jgi:hypothetical protein
LRVSNHEARISPLILRDAACAAPQDEGRWRNASQFAGVPGPVRGEGFFGVRIELARTGIAFDRVVELLRVESLKPRAKPRELRGASFSTAFSMSSAVVMSEI